MFSSSCFFLVRDQARKTDLPTRITPATMAATPQIRIINSGLGSSFSIAMTAATAPMTRGFIIPRAIRVNVGPQQQATQEVPQ